MYTARASETEWNLLPLWSNTAFKLTYMNQLKDSIVQGSVQVAILPLTLGCYFSTLDHRPKSHTPLRLTASS